MILKPPAELRRPEADIVAASIDIVRQLTARTSALEQGVRRILDAIDWCEGNRGRFSCVEAHDSRCPKSRADSPEKWKGTWECECGAEELEAAIKELMAAIGRV